MCLQFTARRGCDLRVGDLLIATEQSARAAEFAILEQLTDVEILSSTPLYREEITHE